MGALLTLILLNSETEIRLHSREKIGAEKMKKRSWKVLGMVFFLSVTLLGFSRGTVHSQESDESVVLVHLLYEYGKWSVGPDGVTILPCEAPRQIVPGSKSDSLIQVLGQDGKVLHERQIRNPRRVLYEVVKHDEAAKTRHRLAPKRLFKYKFPLVPGMEVFKFWHKPESQKEPDIVVDLRGAIKDYWSKGGAEQDATCQAPYPFFAPYVQQ